VNLITIQTKLAGVDIPAYFVGEPGRADLQWSLDLLDKLPDDSGAELFRQYLKRRKKGKAYNARTANLWLRGRVDWLVGMMEAFPVELRKLRNQEHRELIAIEQASQSALLLHEMTEHGTMKADPIDCYHQVGKVAKQWGFLPPLPAMFASDDACEAWVASVLVRLLDDAWWIRRINRAYDRYTEHSAILVGKVRKGVSAYMSDANLKIHRQRKTAAAIWMRDMLVVNETHGFEISLEQAILAGVANPAIRRHELMVRMRGFEDVATEAGHVGLFITWTAPSRFHAWRQARNGKSVENDKYTGCTPRETQRYLCGLWAKCRAKLGREGIQPYGFRVCEPHHDGTPHWHMLLFVQPEQLAQCVSIMQAHAITDDREELVRHHRNGRPCPEFTDLTPRFDWQVMDPEKGSATGYIAKYIAKNLDGHAVGIDEETGQPAEVTSTAVTGWASWWGLRQFQQIGGPSVSVWRELRRMPDPCGPSQDQVLEACRRAADAGDWKWFVEAMGGPILARNDRPVRLLNVIKEAANRYGEDVTKLMGLVGRINSIETRLEGWVISRVGLSARQGVGSGARQGDALALPGASRAPWSSDNNCTGRSRTGEKGSPGRPDRVLAESLLHLGLSLEDIERMHSGAVVQLGGTYYRISNGMLMDSPVWNGARNDELHRGKAFEDAGWELPPDRPTDEQLIRRVKAGHSSLETDGAGADDAFISTGTLDHGQLVADVLAGKLALDQWMDGMPEPELSTGFKLLREELYRAEQQLEQEQKKQGLPVRDNPRWEGIWEFFSSIARSKDPVMEALWYDYML